MLIISKKVKVIWALLLTLSFMNLACFSSYRISLDELAKLQAGYESERVPVIINYCDAGGQAQSYEGVMVASAGEFDPNIDPSTGCPVVYVRATDPIAVHTRDGQSYRITPFNFTISETQLVSPDYDLLISRARLDGAEVQTFSTVKTVVLIASITVAAVGAFAAISIWAPAERGLGGGS